AGAIGEVVIKSTANMIGYWDNPKATQEVVNDDGWFRSGDLGYFDGIYVSLDTFWIGKGAAGPGIHKVKYHFIDTAWQANWNIADSSVCWLYDSLNVLVAPLDSIYIDTLGPLCLNAPSQLLTCQPPGGIFKDSTQTTIDSFLASNYGVGTHLITYTYVDSNGCKYTDTTRVQVTQAPIVEIKIQDISCIPCYGASAWAVADTITYPNLKYYWSNGDTTRKTHAFSGDTLIVWIQNTDSTCFGIDTLIIDIPNCCDMTPSFDPGYQFVYTPENPLEWNDEELVIDGDIVIKNQHNAVINASTITMLSCTKIIVENGSTLTITDSKIGGCGWKGIEVWGNIDVCSDNPDQGIVIVENSEINCADIAIFSGLKDMSSGARIVIAYAGGIIKADDAHFKANYVDLFFTPQNFIGMCNCTTSPTGHLFQHEITDCTFDTLANDYYCDPIVDDILGYLESYFVPTPPPGPPNFCGGAPYGYWKQLPVFSRCHIVDMNPYNEYFVATYPSIFNCTNSCDKRTWRDGAKTGFSITYSGNITYSPNVYIGRTFNGHVTNCTSFIPSSYFK
ncbi:MAG: hypothetical protein ACPGLV_14395, partial [Bacteroidia bacterium]